ncbi:DNA-binding response regulator [Paenibacillus sp. J31TS4]|uniref:response regulator transcription factor n=1 Tax=Paenibacillus sp. J31TS4 TaxID=2807195 RepID=UPI001B16138C|nr:response regulator transcription factor [Paenibacillus sp. J31TS4]GIP40519.1 DNA-binding response regulator [Paenibacillus sp. J31TS4]
MPYKLLIVDDEADILSLLEQALRKEGYDVYTAENGEQAMAQLVHRPDLILLDVMLPGVSGLELCQMIREEASCPILFVSARQTEADRIRGLSIGGDDYITKPFSLLELKARVAAHLRRDQRTAAQTEQRTVLRYGFLQLDLKGREVQIRRSPVALTSREFDLLAALALHPGQVFSKEQLYDRVWGLEAAGDAATVTEHIKNIRAKLAAADPDTSYIATVWGVGYKWERHPS